MLDDEEQYLRAQTEQAKLEISSRLRGLKYHAAEAASPRRLMSTHPWISLGTAAATGFLAARFIARPRTPENDHPLPPPVKARRSFRKWLARGQTILSLLTPVIQEIIKARAAYTEPHNGTEPASDSVRPNS